MNERLIIEVNKWEYVRDLVVSILLTAVTAFLCIVDAGIFKQINLLYWLFRGICAFGALFFAYRTVMLIIKMLDRRPLLLVDENGITDNSSPISLGFVAWEDIQGIYLEGQIGMHTIEVDIKNEEKYISKLERRKQEIIYENIYSDYATMSIDLGLSEEDCQDIVVRMQQMFDEFQKG